MQKRNILICSVGSAVSVLATVESLLRSSKELVLCDIGTIRLTDKVPTELVNQPMEVVIVLVDEAKVLDMVPDLSALMKFKATRSEEGPKNDVHWYHRYLKSNQRPPRKISPTRAKK